jgi:hypothetical protein
MRRKFQLRFSAKFFRTSLGITVSPNFRLNRREKRNSEESVYVRKEGVSMQKRTEFEAKDNL